MHECPSKMSLTNVLQHPHMVYLQTQARYVGPGIVSCTGGTGDTTGCMQGTTCGPQSCGYTGSISDDGRGLGCNGGKCTSLSAILIY